jgi:hypothetical protein
MRKLLQRFFASTVFGNTRCMQKCPNCANGACSKDSGHSGLHYCNYDEKPFG